MTDKPTGEQIVEALKRRYTDALKNVSFPGISKEINDLTDLVDSLPEAVSKVRDRGYAFAGYLSTQIENLGETWDTAQGQAGEALRTEVAGAKAASSKLLPLVKKLEAAAAQSAMVDVAAGQLEAQIDAFESQIEEAEERVQDVFEPVARQAREIKNRIGKLNWYMDRVDEATFEFNATEAVYLVARGEWIKTGKGKEDPDGLLYLTDQRLIFERKEKEGGFLGFGAKKVQGIEWQIPLHGVEGVESEKKGFLGGKDIVHIQHGEGGVATPVSLEVKGGLNANWYAQQLERAQRGDIEQERAVQPDPEIVDRVRNAPAACENCGAPFTTPITQAMTELACEYCGTSVRL